MEVLRSKKSTPLLRKRKRLLENNYIMLRFSIYLVTNFYLKNKITMKYLIFISNNIEVGLKYFTLYRRLCLSLTERIALIIYCVIKGNSVP